MLRSLLLAGACLVVCGSLARRAEAAPDDPRIGQLIAKLGDDSFKIREQATAELVKLGLPVKDPVLAALKTSPDPEVKVRCRRVLEVVLEMDFQQKLAAFEADAKGERQHDLPGWSDFRKRVGEGVPERELFLDMQRAEPGILEAANNKTPELNDLLESRCLQVQMQMNGQFGIRKQLTLGTTAALLHVAGAEGVKPTDQVVNAVYNFCQQPAFTTAIRDGSRKNAARKLLGGWILATGDSQYAYQSAFLAMQYDVPEGLVVALKSLEGGANQQHLRQQFLLAVGKLGSAKDVPAVEKFFKDAALCSNMPDPKNPGKQVQTQIRDVALAVAWKLVGQDPKNQGFEFVQANPQMLYNMHTLGFRNDDERNAASKKWDEFKAKAAAEKPEEKKPE